MDKETRKYFEQGKAAILRDAAAGYFRLDEIKSFQDLHDHVDANFYGFGDDVSATVHQANIVTDALDSWIKQNFK